MSDDLRGGLRAAADEGGGSRPDVADLWRTGRRRRSARRMLGAAAMVVVVLVVGASVAFLATGDDAETVRSGAIPETCRPRSLTPSGSSVTIDQALLMPPEAPKTPEAMVRGGGSEHLQEPTVVARVEVLEIDERPFPREDLRGPTPPPEVRAWVEVVDPVFGADAGDRFTISDLGEGARRVELEALKKTLMQQIEDFQQDVDDLDRPLAEIDAQILAMSPDDPRYEALLVQREQVKQATDTGRIAAQNQLNDYQQRLQLLQLSERLASSSPAGTPCYRFEPGDELVVALFRPGDGPYELTGSSSFFLIDGNGFSAELNAARRSVPGWTDSELLRLARESTPDEFLDRLRDAAED